MSDGTMRKQTKRKVWALVNPITHAIEGAAITGGPNLDKLRTRELVALEAFAKGRAGLQEWSDLAAMLNLAECMAMDGIGPEVMETCKKSQAHLIEAAKRYENTGKMGLTGLGLQSIRDLYEYHDLQRTSISRAEYEKAIQQTINRVRSKAPEVVDMSTIPV